eukprot:Gb_34568 [translate_table: standard]
MPTDDCQVNDHNGTSEENENENSMATSNEALDDSQSGRYIWVIQRFSKLSNERLLSDTFVAGGCKWRLLVYPRGNGVDFLSAYLAVADAPPLPSGWSRCIHFFLAIVNHNDHKLSVQKEFQHRFGQKDKDWGFPSFISIHAIFDPMKGFLVNDSVTLVAEVKVLMDYSGYNSRKETGFVGLKNQGATCYMNSLLQTLYHIPYFRKAVYHMPTENILSSNSIPLALQSLFYNIQHSDSSVSTKDLTESFGWGTNDAFMQHDVQELNRVLCEKLEDKMKGTVVEGTIQKLFEGHHMNYIECIDVDYKSTRKESFYDLQLDVKGCKDVYDSFDKFVQVEKLEGDNKYQAEQFGLQDARKGVLFVDFPPVLQLHLKRFEYDFNRDSMMKINDRYEFPLQLDLDTGDGRYLSPDTDRTVRNLYSLHSVLVHSGGVHGGHYYAFIRPMLSEQWYKFDDERVTKENEKTVLEEQYGGEVIPQGNLGSNNTAFKFTRHSNAYMLVYVRESDKDKIICNIDDKDIARHLNERLKREQQENENKRKEAGESHLYIVVKVACEDDFFKQVGEHIHFELVDFGKVLSLRVQKKTVFSEFKGTSC